MNKIIFSIIIAFSLVAVAFIVASDSSSGRAVPAGGNVEVIEGRQIIDLLAKGGYSPEVTTAKAGIPTILRVNTKNTFDCSASIVIPSLNYAKILPNKGSTEIDLGTPVPGRLAGTCGMGMYPFEIDFKL